MKIRVRGRPDGTVDILFHVTRRGERTVAPLRGLHLVDVEQATLERVEAMRAGSRVGGGTSGTVSNTFGH